MKPNLKHKLILIVDSLLEIKGSEDWESTTTPQQDNQLTEIIDSLDQLYFAVRNQIIIK